MPRVVRPWIAGLAACGLAGLACIVRPSLQAPTISQATSYSTRQVQLENGLRVVLEQAPDFGAAAATLVVGAGSADEPPGKAGLAHLTEHVVFNGAHAGVSFRSWARNPSRRPRWSKRCPTAISVASSTSIVADRGRPPCG